MLLMPFATDCLRNLSESVATLLARGQAADRRDYLRLIQGVSLAILIAALMTLSAIARPHEHQRAASLRIAAACECSLTQVRATWALRKKPDDHYRHREANTQ